MPTFKIELEKCGFTESDIRIIKSLIFKYAPKNEEVEIETCCTCDCFQNGRKSYRTELFNSLTIKEEAL